jgi:E3 ubiquitin-protein ligase HERC3
VKCWGRNRFAQLGQLDSTVQIGDDPTETGDGIPVVSLGTGRTVRQLSTTGTSYHNCVLLDDHSVKCWGDNSSGELGLGDTTSRGDLPGQMGDNLPPVQL